MNVPAEGGVSIEKRVHVKPTPKELFIPHDVCMEMRWDQMYRRGYLTPTALFFIRNHGPTPIIDAKTWSLRVEGPGVARPLQLGYEDIIRLRSKTFVRFLECAGNGRQLFSEHQGTPPKGRPWRLGGFGVAEWTGVPLRQVLELAQIKPTAVDVMPTGLDEKHVERPMPVRKAMEEDTLLAYAMNGDVLAPDHGFPIRVVVPGWVAINSIKWVGRIFVSEEPIFVERNTEEYVLAGPDYPRMPPALGPVLTTTTPKTAIALPWPAELPAGKHLIRGFSWSPFGAIAQVEYTLDGGRVWMLADLREPNVPAAGCRWEFFWDAPPGRYTIAARATDSQENRQPDPKAIKWNNLGYDFWGYVHHPVVVR